MKLSAQITGLIVGLLLTSAAVAQTPTTTKPNVSNILSQCLANVPVVGNGSGVSPICHASGALGALSFVTAGTGVAAALALNVGSAGAPVLFNGAGGTPSSLTLTNATGLPTTGLTGALQAAQEPAHTGDVTNSAGSLALTLSAGNAGNLNSGTLLAARMPALTGDCTTSAGAVATTCTKINGSDLTSSWTTYTPTVTSGSGTPTTVSAAGRWKQMGKIVFAQVTVTITTVGTASGVVFVPLPTNASTSGVYIGTCYEFITTGNTGAAAIIGSSNATRLQTAQYNGTTFWVNGYQVGCSVTYETP